ncbi:zinc finger CCCH domain-containing protein 34-like, partial [Trifolium medium]|nr:zinc finger CCCH domain-containing protein 34-like [Trifolium medium]
HSSTEQSSEEQEDSHVEPEERWESSPGFDVLVHDESGNLGYENDSEYLPVLDMDDHELNEQYLGEHVMITDVLIEILLVLVKGKFVVIPER